MASRATPGVELSNTRGRGIRARSKVAPRPSDQRYSNRRKATVRVVRGAFRVLLYLGMTLAPLVLAWSGIEPGRGFLIDFSVALGFLGLSLMGLQFLVAARSRWVAAPFGTDALLQYHRQIGHVSLLFILAHPLLLFVADSGYFALLDVTTAPLRAQMAVISTVALLVLVALSIWRKKLRIGYELWQLPVVC